MQFNPISYKFFFNISYSDSCKRRAKKTIKKKKKKKTLPWALRYLTFMLNHDSP